MLRAYRTAAWRLLFCLVLGIVLAVVLPALLAQTPPPTELRIAAAADLQPVLPTLAAAYTKLSGVTITPTFGPSATLTQQIQNGAPVDLFLSADCTHPAQLIATHLAPGPEPTLYARGTLVLWARRDSPAQPLSLDALRTPRVTRIAVANPAHAPYGQAAAALLHALQLDQALTPKLVTGENIAQTAQFAQTGNAQAAFVSLTLALSPALLDTGSYLALPKLYPAITQCGVTLLRSSHRPAAEAFLHWLTSPATQSQLPHYGLEPAH